MKRLWIFASLLALTSLLAGVGFLGAAEPPDVPVGDPNLRGFAVATPDGVRYVEPVTGDLITQIPTGADNRPGVAAPIPESVRNLDPATGGPAAAPPTDHFLTVPSTSSVPAFAQTTVEMELQVWLVNQAVRHPWLAVVLLLIASARLGLKPLMAAAHRYVERTAGPQDNEALARFEASRTFWWLSFALDVLGSVKLTTVLLFISRFRGTDAVERGRALAVVGLAGLFLLGTPGCGTLGGGGEGLTPLRVQRITRTAVFGTATVWTIKKPESRPAFEAALRGITVLVSEERWDTAALAASLTGTGVDTFTGDEARLIIAGTTLAMETLAGSEVDLSNSEYARAVILGAQAGLQQALTGSVTTPAN